MKVKELVEKLNLKVLSGEKGLDREIDGCYISDLLSDVMGNAMEGNIWITLQTHKRDGRGLAEGNVVHHPGEEPHA